MSTRLIRHTVLTALADKSKPAYDKAKKLIERLAEENGVNIISCQSLIRVLNAFDTHRRKQEALTVATHLCRILPVQESDIQAALIVMAKSPKISLDDAVETAFISRIKPDEVIDL